MRGISVVSKFLAIALVSLVAVGIAGCGSDDESTSTSEAATATQDTTQTSSGAGSEDTRESIDSAVSNCENQADELSAIPGAALSAACQEVGDAFKRNLDNADENVDQALSDAAKSCRDLAGNIPAGSARDALDSLCETISAER